MKIKRVMTYSHGERKVRICRLLWSPGNKTGPLRCGGHKRSLSINLQPKVVSVVKDFDSFRLTILGFQLHLKTCTYGGLV